MHLHSPSCCCKRLDYYKDLVVVVGAMYLNIRAETSGFVGSDCCQNKCQSRLRRAVYTVWRLEWQLCWQCLDSWRLLYRHWRMECIDGGGVRGRLLWFHFLVLGFSLQ
jgi:hypothetical protein